MAKVATQTKPCGSRCPQIGHDIYLQFQLETTINAERYQHKMGVNSNEIKVMELQNRWASCTSGGNINFYWKCAMAPIDVLNYIVVHELAHLIHNNHTAAFWNEIDKVIPNYDKQVQWLKVNGAGMDL